MGHDPRRNPDPSTLRGRTYYAVDGFDARDGIQIRALFEARTVQQAVAICQRDAMCGDLYEVTSGAYLEWKRWADSLIPMHTRVILPLPSSGTFVGRLEVQRPEPPVRRLVLPGRG